MYVELHLLQNFAPSCLNRDDTNTPKDCEFGGHRRARISSQCIKRSIRRYFREHELLPPEHLAERSKRLIGEVARRLQEKGRDTEVAHKLVRSALDAVKLSADDKNETQYLLFLGRNEIAGLAEVVHAHWDELHQGLAPAPDAPAEPEKAKRKTAKQQKVEAKEKVPPEVAKKVKALFDGGKAADLAMFGRMLADQADLNRDAACQVAHAVSTNRVSMEMDFFTAVDDLKGRGEDAGAGMLGTVDFNSACFYRYANINFDLLCENLQDDGALARKTVAAFLEASIHAIPTGKQNTFAAHNPPSLVFAVVRDRGLYSLANAFERPVRPGGRAGLVGNSVQSLDAYWGRLTRMYGTDGLKAASLCVEDESAELQSLQGYRVASAKEVIESVLQQLPNGEGRR